MSNADSTESWPATTAPVTIGEPGRATAEVRAGAPQRPWGWPDTALDAACLHGLEVRAAARRGLAHIHQGVPRQDAYSLGVGADKTLIVTVCDGVGSLPGSHEVAQRACSLLPSLVGFPVDWAAALAAVSANIAELPGATTLTAAIVRQLPAGAAAIDVAWIGDSTAWLLRAGSWLRLGDAAQPQDGVADPITHALPSDTISYGSWSGRAEAGDALFLMTDGVGLPLGTGGGEVGKTLAERWATPPAMLDFAAQVGFARRGFDDDRTVVGVWVPAGTVDATTN